MTKVELLAAELREIEVGGLCFSEAVVEGDIIQNVSLLGAVSSNGRVYTQAAMQDAVKLYNGVQVFVNHPSYSDLTGTGGRKFEDLAGKVMNTRLAGERVRGDIHLIPGEPIAEKLKSVAEKMPDIAGFSHRARGEARTAEDGTVIIERLLEVMALEIVVDPATTDGLFESKMQTPTGAEEMKDLNAVTLEELKAGNPGLVTQIEEAAIAVAKADGKQSEKMTAALAKIETLEAEKKELEGKVDASETADALRAREELLVTKLAEAKLPEKAVSERFMKELREATDEAAVDEIIADRKELVESIPKGQGNGGPKQPARKVNVDEGEKTEPKPVTDDVLAEAMGHGKGSIFS